MADKELLSYEHWCQLNNTDHGHCPDDCEHPQPIILNNQCICGRCFFKFNEIVEILPCTPENC